MTSQLQRRIAAIVPAGASAQCEPFHLLSNYPSWWLRLRRPPTPPPNCSGSGSSSGSGCASARRYPTPRLRVPHPRPQDPSPPTKAPPQLRVPVRNPKLALGKTGKICSCENNDLHTRPRPRRNQKSCPTLCFRNTFACNAFLGTRAASVAPHEIPDRAAWRLWCRLSYFFHTYTLRVPDHISQTNTHDHRNRIL